MDIKLQHLWKVAVEEENLYKELSLLKNFYLLGFGPFFKDFLLEASALSLQPVRKHFSHGNSKKLSFIRQAMINTEKIISLTFSLLQISMIH